MVKSSFKRGARFMCCGQGARPVRPATLRSEGSATPAWSRRDLCQPRAFSRTADPSCSHSSLLTHSKHEIHVQARQRHITQKPNETSGVISSTRSIAVTYIEPETLQLLVVLLNSTGNLSSRSFPSHRLRDFKPAR